MGNLRLKLSMLGSLGLIVGITTLGAALLLNGVLGLNFIWTLIFIVPFFLLQWYYGPKMVEHSMQVEEAPRDKYPDLHRTVEDISRKVGIDKPQVMVSDMEMPNAFAYGNFSTGKKVAVTRGLLNTLEWEEVEAVLGHEMGHISHNDAEVMMFLSILPALFMMLGRTLLWSSFLGGRRRNGGALIIVALGAMFFYFLLNLAIMWFSRLREFYADQFGATSIYEGSRKLQEGLVKIENQMARLKERGRQQQATAGGGTRNSLGLNPLGSGMKALFIADPDVEASSENLSDREMVEKYKDRTPGLGKKFFELFTTHPELTKRLKALDKFK
ncbi:M48 family metalloprotease [Candidatus Bipolaricaulota bacterium]|nr:M48 family metalloprotease [Candidatus Bipolaricaulota bacterium]